MAPVLFSRPAGIFYRKNTHIHMLLPADHLIPCMHNPADPSDRRAEAWRQIACSSSRSDCAPANSRSLTTVPLRRSSPLEASKECDYIRECTQAVLICCRSGALVIRLISSRSGSRTTRTVVTSSAAASGRFATSAFKAEGKSDGGAHQLASVTSAHC